MESSLLSIIGSLTLLLLGWLGMTVRSTRARIDEVHQVLDSKINDLDDKKVDTKDMEEMKADLKMILIELKTFQVEMARWQGKADALESNKRD